MVNAVRLDMFSRSYYSSSSTFGIVSLYILMFAVVESFPMCSLCDDSTRLSGAQIGYVTW